MLNVLHQVVDRTTVLEVLVGGIMGFIVFLVISNIVTNLSVGWQQRTVTGTAGASGLIISLSLSPLGDFASALSRRFRIVPSDFPELITSFVTVDMGLGLFIGFLIILDSGGWTAAFSFILAFIGGLILPYWHEAGFLMFLFAWVFMEASPAERF